MMDHNLFLFRNEKKIISELSSKFQFIWSSVNRKRDSEFNQLWQLHVCKARTVWSNLVIKPVSICFDKCTTQMVTHKK